MADPETAGADRATVAEAAPQVSTAEPAAIVGPALTEAALRMPAALTLEHKTKSVEPAPVAAPPPQELRRFRSEPASTTYIGPESQRFTDRLLLLLTSTTAPPPLLTRAASVPADAGELTKVEAAKPAELGKDPPLRDSAASRPGKCGICMEDQDSTFQICSDPCCEYRFCEECISGWAKEKVSSALWAVPWLHCPGCDGRVPTSAWQTHNKEAFDTYENNAKALLTFRCSSCHDVGTLFVEPDYNEPISNLRSALTETAMDRLKEVWPEYVTASQPPESILDILPGSPDVLLSGIVDIERRTCLHLAYLRRNPFILTPCCDSEFCFKCKIGSHHEDISCEQRQHEELDIHCQFCPECEVPTVRTEGCDHIVCVCGADWTWQETREAGYALGPASFLKELLDRGDLDPNWSNDDEDGRTLLQYTVMEGRMANTQLLIEAAANVNAEDDEQISVLLYALGVQSVCRDDFVDLLLENKAEYSREDPFKFLRGGHNPDIDGFNRILDLTGLEVDETSTGRTHASFAGCTLLQISIERGRVRMVNELLDNRGAKADPMVPFWFLGSPLSDLVCFDKLLKACGGCVDELRDGASQRLIVASMAKGKISIATHLVLTHKARATFPELARPPGLWPNGAVIPPDIFDALLEQGQSVWQKDENGKVVLLPYAVRQMKYSQDQFNSHLRERWIADANKLISRICGDLWDDEGDALARSAEGADLLLQCIPARAFQVAKKLIEKKASLDARDDRGHTPLLKLASEVALNRWSAPQLHDWRYRGARNASQPAPQNREEDLALMELLLEARADVLHRSNTGETAVDIARQSTWKDGIDRLQTAFDEAKEEAAKRAALSGDGSIDNVGIKLDGQVGCPDCKQRFDTARARDIHWKFIHDPNRHQED